MTRTELLNRYEHLKDEVYILTRRNEIDCNCNPNCHCKDDVPYSSSAIYTLNVRIDEIKRELNKVWGIKVV